MAISAASIGYDVGTVSRPQTGFFPFLIGLGLFVVGILEIVAMMSKGNRRGGEERRAFNKVIDFKALKIICLLLLWPTLLSFLGYALVIFLFTLIMAKTLELEGWLKPLALAVGNTLTIHYMFKVWFYLDFPEGMVMELLRGLLGG